VRIDDSFPAQVNRASSRRGRRASDRRVAAGRARPCRLCRRYGRELRRCARDLPLNPYDAAILGNPIPILVLTARDAIDDRAAGLDGGADDYLVKRSR
jgi:PleD family two-component response regulator